MKPRRSKPLPPAAPELAPELDPDFVQATTAAAEEREQAWTEDAGRTWHGVLLHPWSEERARLLDALCAADVPIPDLSTCDPVTFVQGLFPRAVKLLFLMHHSPQELQALRPRLLSVIDAWGVEHVPAADIGEKKLAVAFALQVEGAHRKMQALRRPSRQSRRGDDSGN
jgi:hypothetical protein